MRFCSDFTILYDVTAAGLASPARRAAMTGVYAEGNFFLMNSTGDLQLDAEGVYKDRFQVWLQANLTVHAVGTFFFHFIKKIILAV